jgi:hypothetical protein
MYKEIMCPCNMVLTLYSITALHCTALLFIYPDELAVVFKGKWIFL